jgi:hypothetical protein
MLCTVVSIVADPSTSILGFLFGRSFSSSYIADVDNSSSVRCSSIISGSIGSSIISSVCELTSSNPAVFCDCGCGCNVETTFFAVFGAGRDLRGTFLSTHSLHRANCLPPLFWALLKLSRPFCKYKGVS